MCEYCEKNKEIIDTNSNGWHALGITKQSEKDGGIYTIDMFTPFGLWCKPINYCPMCGRKLVQNV